MRRGMEYRDWVSKSDDKHRSMSKCAPPCDQAIPGLVYCIGASEDTFLEVHDDRLLEERSRHILELLMHWIIVDIVVSVLIRVELKNESVRDAAL